MKKSATSSEGCLSHVSKLHGERGKTSMLDNCGEGPQQSCLAPPLSQGWCNNKAGLNIGGGVKATQKRIVRLQKQHKSART